LKLLSTGILLQNITPFLHGFKIEDGKILTDDFDEVFRERLK
jgi:hypothetical protein